MAPVSLKLYDGSRENNFTFIRILCAWAVIYGHGFAIQNPLNTNDPLNYIFKGSNYIGGFAVDAFFIISGFLVTGSLLKQGALHYTISRCLRVFPALAVCILLSIFIIGWSLTTLPTNNYFSSSITHSYLINILPFIDITYSLPGVFENHSNQAVNGSLWTLIVEFRCYILLLIAGIFGLLLSRTIANVSALTLLLFGLYFFSSIPLLGKGEDIHWPHLALYFLIGVVFYLNRDHVILSPKLAALSLILIFASFGQPWFQYIFPIAFAYSIFFIAYQTPFINFDKKLGDISYGIYIYGWPTQQVVASLFPNLHPSGNILISTLIVLPVAYISWHFIESPALTLKKYIPRSLK